MSRKWRVESKEVDSGGRVGNYSLITIHYALERKMEYVVCFVLGAAAFWWLQSQFSGLRLQALQQDQQIVEQLTTLQKEWTAYQTRLTEQVQAITQLVNRNEAALADVHHQLNGPRATVRP